MCDQCDKRGSGWARSLLTGPGCPGDARPAQPIPHQPRDPVTFDLFPKLETVAESQQLYPAPRLVR